MTYKQILLTFVILYSVLEVNCQTLPYYGASKYFSVNQANLLMGSGPQTYSLPATFPISTAVHRTPFYSITKVEHFKTYLDQTFHLWTDLPSFTSSSFVIRMYYYFVTTSNVTVRYGLELNTNVKFRYLVVLDTFPDKFLSLNRIVSAVSYPMAANSFI